MTSRATYLTRLLQRDIILAPRPNIYETAYLKPFVPKPHQKRLFSASSPVKMPAKHSSSDAEAPSSFKQAKLDPNSSSKSNSNGAAATNGNSSNEKNGNEEEDGSHRYQASSTTHREEDQWKFRAPYAIHKKEDHFDVKWKGKCHCGKVQYQLSREKPLASKYCHCTTCQRLHGVSFLLLHSCSQPDVRL
jgi:hypothetical protein